MDNITGKTLGSWEGMLPMGMSDSKIKAKEEVGKGFATKEEALKAARDNQGAETLVKGDDGKIHVYSIDDGSKSKFTRDSIEQVKDYPVSNITTKGSQVKNVISFVTEDNYEIVSPEQHKNKFSGEHYNFTGKDKVSGFIGKTPNDLQKLYNANSTEGVSRANQPASVKQALEPTLKILEKFDPKAADWLRNLKDSDYVVAGDSIKSMGRSTEIYAAWTAIIREGLNPHVNVMVLGNHFWELNDIDKASTLLHEYTHAVDNPVERQFNKLYGTVENLINKDYGDKAEDKAYIAQWKMLKAAGRNDGIMHSEVMDYFEGRKIDPSKL